MYLYETHTHTSEGSACSSMSGAASAREHRAAGYTGIVVTDHFYHGNTAISRTLPWPDWVRSFCAGYRAAREEGERIGLQVFFGWESGYHGTEFLVYGLDEAWLLDHPEIRDATVAEQHRLVREGGGMVVHAHPFREEPYIPHVRLYPEDVDAVEVRNGAHSSPVSTSHFDPPADEAAAAYAARHGLPVTAGSDTHHADRMLGGGMVFDRRLDSVQELMDAIRMGTWIRLLPEPS